MNTRLSSRPMPWLVLLLVCWFSTAAATEDVQLEIPLARLMSADRPLRLEKAHGIHTLSIPLSARTQVRTATLELRLVNSVSLLKHRSQLTVSLNERVVAQVPLDPQAPEASALVKIPAGYFKPGYNRLRFEAAQHYTERCEDSTAPELWTEIDTQQSRLLLELRPRDLGDVRLSELDELFDEKLWGEHRVNLVSAGQTDEQILQWGGLLAQGVALRFNYVPVAFRHLKAAPAAEPVNPELRFPGLEQTPLADGDSLLVGTREQLAPFLGAAVAGRIQGAHIAVYPLDADPRRLVLLVTGDSPEQVTLAARAFAFLTLPFPDSRWMSVDSVQPPPSVPHSTGARLLPNGDYPFSRFGFHTRTLKGMDVEPAVLNLTMPPDLYAPETTEVELDLHLAFGAGMRNDSVLNLFLNGNFETSIPLADPRGGNYSHYRVKIRLRDLQPGPNSIELRPLLIPLVSGECELLNSDNLLLTLFEDSRLRMPNASHFASLPDLRLFALTGFPHTEKGDGSDLYLHLAAADPDTAAAAWTLLGKLAQRNGMALHQARVSLQRPREPVPAVVLGGLADLDPTLLAEAPIRPGDPAAVPYPVAPAIASDEGSMGWLDRLSWKVRDFLALEDTPTRGYRQALVHLGGGPGRYTMAMQYRSRALGDGPITLFAAEDAATLSNGIERLIQPEFWNSLSGDVTLWREARDSIASARLGDDFQVGELDAWWWANFQLSRNPWAWGALVLTLVLTLAWLGTHLLKAFRRRHRPDSGTADVDK
jgi:hypothetical protein